MQQWRAGERALDLLLAETTGLAKCCGPLSALAEKTLGRIAMPSLSPLLELSMAMHLGVHRSVDKPGRFHV